MMDQATSPYGDVPYPEASSLNPPPSVLPPPMSFPLQNAPPPPPNFMQGLLGFYLKPSLVPKTDMVVSSNLTLKRAPHTDAAVGAGCWGKDFEDSLTTY